MGKRNGRKKAGEKQPEPEYTFEAPSTLKVLFYTLFLPLILLVWFGKDITPSNDPNYTIYGSTRNVAQPSFDGRDVHAANPTPAVSSNTSPPTDSSKPKMGNTGGASSSTISNQSSKAAPAQKVVGVDPSEKRPQSTHQRAQIAERAQVDNKISLLRKNVNEQPFDIKSLIELANNLRNRNTIFSEGGIDDKEAVWCYERAIRLLKDTREQVMSKGADDQLALVDTFLCVTTYYLGLVWSGSDMYEDAIKVFAEAQNYKCGEDDYFNILIKRGYAYMIMGEYENAINDYFAMYKIDRDKFLNEGLGTVVRIAESNKNAIPGGWDWIVDTVVENLERITHELDSAFDESLREEAAKKLQKMHLALWTYHDKVSNDTANAWKHLQLSQRFKQIYTMSLPEMEYDHSKYILKDAGDIAFILNFFLCMLTLTSFLF